MQQDITSLMNNQLYFSTASGMSLLLEITMASVVHAGKPSVMLLLRSRASQQEKDDYSETTNQLRNSSLPIR